MKSTMLKRLLSFVMVLAMVMSLVAMPVSATTDDSQSDVVVTSEGTTSGDTTSEDTTSGDTTSEDTTSGDTTSGDTTSEDTTSEDTTSEDTTSEDTTSGDTTSEDTTSEDTTSEDTTSEDATSEDTPLCSHEGGSASCKELAVCDLCQESYGDYAAHTGGSATCSVQAVCEACNTPYGELAVHNYGTDADGKCDVCGADCAHSYTDGVCTVCGAAAPVQERVCTCGTDDPAIHATNCPLYVAPENPECFCAEKCTAETLNVWCDVCGVQGVEACECEDEAILYNEAEASYQTEANGEWKTDFFTEALANVYEGGTVKLLKDIVLTETVTVTKNVTITSNDVASPKQITSTTSGHGYLLRLNANVTMQNVIVDGGSGSGITATRALIAVGDGKNSGKLTLASGAVLRNNNNSTKNGAGGAVCVILGDLVVSGGQITGNTAYSGSAIAVIEASCNVTIGTDSVISGNSATNTRYAGGGAIYISAGTVTMIGGEIKNNYAAQSGGAIHISKGTVTMTGGEIKNNCAEKSGGAVYLYSTNSAFKLQGGTITGNTAQYGAGIYSNKARLIELSGGSVTGNTASRWGGGLLIAPDSKVTISSSINISGNSNSSGEVGANLYLDGNDFEGVYMPAVTLDMLDSTAKIDMYSWLKPADGGELLIANPASGYTITADDMGKLSYEDTNYILKRNDSGQVVLVRKQDVTISVEGVEDYTYDGQPKSGYTGTPAATGYTGNFVVEYSGTQADGTTYGPSTTAPTNAGSYSVKFSIPASDPQFTGATTLTFEIGKAPLTITAEDKTAVVGEDKPALTYTVIGLIGSDTLTKDPTLDCEVDMTKAGEYTITPSGAEAGANYAITTTSYVAGKLTVKEKQEYNVTVADTTNGTVTVSANKAVAGTQIVITAAPKNGWYTMKSLVVTNAAGESVPVALTPDGNYAFTMPESDVTVTATFGAKYIVIADTTNPKTGDSIMMASAIMFVSATALAVLLLGKKKRVF